MKKLVAVIFVFVVLSCSNEKISFSNKTVEQKSSLPCQEICTAVKISVPFAAGESEVSDSINKHVLNVSKEVVYFGENPKATVNYEEITQSFIQSYEDMQQKFPEESMGWEAKVIGSVAYQSEDIVNIKISYYNFTGGAHGFSGIRSLVIDKKDGALLTPNKIFKDVAVFSRFAEHKFRETFNIPKNHTINSNGFMFEEDKFKLPNNIIFTEKGIVLYFNVYEIASYAEGPKQLFLTFDEIKDFLKIK